MPARSKSIPTGVTELLSLQQMALVLGIHPGQLDRLVAIGCPAIDVGVPRLGRRPKRALRFNPDRVLAWLSNRANKAQGGN